MPRHRVVDQGEPGNTKFLELTEADLPLHIVLVDHDTGELLWRTTITDAGAVKVPGFTPRRVRSYVIEKSGWCTVAYPGGWMISGEFGVPTP